MVGKGKRKKDMVNESSVSFLQAMDRKEEEGRQLQHRSFILENLETGAAIYMKERDVRRFGR